MKCHPRGHNTSGELIKQCAVRGHIFFFLQRLLSFDFTYQMSQMRRHPPSNLSFLLSSLPPSTFHTLHHSSWPCGGRRGTQSPWPIEPMLGVNPSSSSSRLLLNHQHAFCSFCRMSLSFFHLPLLLWCISPSPVWSPQAEG